MLLLAPPLAGVGGASAFASAAAFFCDWRITMPWMQPVPQIVRKEMMQDKNTGAVISEVREEMLRANDPAYRELVFQNHALDTVCAPAPYACAPSRAPCRMASSRVRAPCGRSH